MVMTASTMLALGTALPDFKLPDVVSGTQVSPSTFKDKKLLLVIFLCEHCPYVKHVKEELARLGGDYLPKGVGIVGISSNVPGTHPDDSPENLRRMAESLKLGFPICFDATQGVAKAFRAACTPEFYLFDGARKLVYRGQLDDSRPKNAPPVTGKDLREALESALSGRPLSPEQKPGIGCNIKWRPGNEPDYFQG